MPTVNFTPNLQRHLACPPREVEGNTVALALAAVFAEHPKLQGYVLDEQRSLRKHITVFVDGRMIHDRQNLSDSLTPASELLVMQALSGG